jgi:hypothetical protein
MFIIFGKIYLKKLDSKNDYAINNLILDNFLFNPVASSIKKIAYEGFKNGKHII